METLKTKRLEELIFLGIKGVNFISYMEPDVNKYFTIYDMCVFTRDVECLEDFEQNYAVKIINLVLDGDE